MTILSSAQVLIAAVCIYLLAKLYLREIFRNNRRRSWISFSLAEQAFMWVTKHMNNMVHVPTADSTSLLLISLPRMSRIEVLSFIWGCPVLAMESLSPSYPCPTHANYLDQVIPGCYSLKTLDSCSQLEKCRAGFLEAQSWANLVLRKLWEFISEGQWWQVFVHTPTEFSIGILKTNQGCYF